MSGELILEKASQWKGTALALLLSCLLAGGAAVVCLRYLPLEGMKMTICAAVLVYVLFRVLYPVFARLFIREERDQAGTWRVTPDTLYLNDLAIPRSNIKMVYCWPNRNALGHSSAGWTVNIETTGKNQLLRSLTSGEEADRSVRQLRALVVALGYGAQWRES